VVSGPGVTACGRCALRTCGDGVRRLADLPVDQKRCPPDWRLHRQGSGHRVGGVPRAAIVCDRRVVGQKRNLNLQALLPRRNLPPGNFFARTDVAERVCSDSQRRMSRKRATVIRGPMCASSNQLRNACCASWRMRKPCSACIDVPTPEPGRRWHDRISRTFAGNFFRLPAARPAVAELTRFQPLYTAWAYLSEVNTPKIL